MKFDWCDILIAIAIAMMLSCSCFLSGIDLGKRQTHRDAIDADAGKFVADPQTGQVKFVWEKQADCPQ
jgi:hypothetical protein